MTAAKEQEEKQTKIESGIEQCPAFKKQFHPFGAVHPLRQGETDFQTSANQQDIITLIHQKGTNLVDPLIGIEIIGNGYDDFFVGHKCSSISNATSGILVNDSL